MFKFIIVFYKMELELLCKNKLFLFIVFSIVSIIVSAGMYYYKDVDDREKLDTNKTLKEIVLPSSLLSLALVGTLYYFKGITPDEVMLDKEDFYD